MLDSAVMYLSEESRDIPSYRDMTLPDNNKALQEKEPPIINLTPVLARRHHHCCYSMPAMIPLAGGQIVPAILPPASTDVICRPSETSWLCWSTAPATLRLQCPQPPPSRAKHLTL
jgi:hypothetical protein